ncbi:MAG: TRC40/GET3/ArsA family transport-energizing ATPase [bacterium]|nr:TRC40/GET3/ArsA family transport-energizing ATPase [bacterium]
MRVILLTGKGGVGKTTHSVTTALGAAAHGHRVFLLSTDAAHSVGDALGRPVGARPVQVAEGVVAQEVSALDELDRSWGVLQRFLRQLLKEETDELVAEELLVFPGLEELISLRAIRDVEATGDFDVCVVDCAPTGSTLRMLRFPDVLRVFMENFFDLERRGARLLKPLLEPFRVGALVPGEELFDAFERLWSDVDDVREILMDTSRTTARLVVNPTQVVLEEARRSFAYLSLYGVATDGVIVNRVLPETASKGWFGRWAARERAILEDIRISFPVPRIEVPLEPQELTGLPALAALAGRLYAERDPGAPWRQGRPIRLRTHSGHPRLEIELPGASKEALEVDARGDSLLIRLRDASRIVALPRSLVGRPVRRARLREGVLAVDFE